MSIINWNNTVERLGPKLYRYFLGSFSPSVADDLVQDTLLRLVRKYQQGQFLPEKGNLDMYAFGIARFVRLEQYKSGSREPLTMVADAPESSHDPFQSLSKDEDLKRLRGAIEQLSEEQQEVILLSIDKDISFNEIAQVMGLPLNTVKSHAHRAKKKLSQMLFENQGAPHE